MEERILISGRKDNKKYAVILKENITLESIEELLSELNDKYQDLAVEHVNNIPDDITVLLLSLEDFKNI